jgi:predicted acylesterase/phospholipase RssA
MDFEPSTQYWSSESRNKDKTSGGSEIFRIFSFPGAGFDTVMQMGLVHALLVTRRKAPDMVAGISVGAITATALGEVLQSSAGPNATPAEDEEVRVARFSELMEAFRNAPSTVMKGFFPDPLETNAAHTLKPVELPRHFKEERDSRRDSAASRTGLIRLFNHLIRLRVTVRAFAQLTRVYMGWRAAGAMGGLAGWWNRLRMAARLWWIVARNIVSLSMPVSLVARVELSELLGINGKSLAKGVEAGHIIFNRWAGLRWLREHGIRFALGFLPLFLMLMLPMMITVAVLEAFDIIHLPLWLHANLRTLLPAIFITISALALWAALLLRKNIFSDLLRHYHIFSDLGDSHSLKEVLVQNFDPAYFGEFKFDENVRRALKQQKPLTGGCGNKKPLRAYMDDRHRRCGTRVVPLAANLATGKLETISQDTSVVDALMCASAVVPFFRAQSIKRHGVSVTYIDGISISNDPIVPVYEEACRILANHQHSRWNSLRIISVPLLPLRQQKPDSQSDPYTGLLDVAMRARELERFQDMLLDKGLVDRVNRTLNGKPCTVLNDLNEKETFYPAKIRLVAPDHAHDLSLRMMQAGSPVERRDLINTSVADGCRAMIERLVTDAMPDTRTIEERRMFLEPDEELPDEWPHQDESQKTTLRDAVDRVRANNQTITRADGTEYVSCRKLLAAWGGLKPLPGGDPEDAQNPDPGPGISEVCRNCITCHAKTKPDGTREPDLLQHIRLPRTACPVIPPPKPVEEMKGPAVVFLFSGGVFRGVFQVGFTNAVSELGIQPDIIAGSSVGTIVGAFTGRVFEKPAGLDLIERQRQTRRMAATFLTIDRFVLTDRLADFARHFSIHAAAADFSPHDLDLVFRRYEKDFGFAFGHRARRVFSGLERLLFISPFEMFELAQTLRAGSWQKASRLARRLVQDMVDRYDVGLELLGPEPLQQLIDGFIFSGKPDSSARLDRFGFPLMGTTTNLTLGQLEILRSTHPWDPRFTQSLLASSAFPAVFRPRWSWEVYRHPEQVAQYADGGIMDNLPLGAVVEFLWGKDSAKRFERHPPVPHLILTATLEPEKADWTGRDDLCSLGWTEIRSRASQLRYNGKIDKFQQGQRDIRRILRQREKEGDEDVHSIDIPLNLDVLAVKPQWLCGTFAFHPMLGYSREKQAASIAHGCASTICAVAEHFDPKNKAHAVDYTALRHWAESRGITLANMPLRIADNVSGPLEFGPLPLSDDEQSKGCCWFRRADPKTGKRPICPYHPNSPSSNEGPEVGGELEKIYLTCGRKATHQTK